MPTPSRQMVGRLEVADSHDSVLGVLLSVGGACQERGTAHSAKVAREVSSLFATARNWDTRVGLGNFAHDWREAAAEIAAVFHWPLSELQALTVADLRRYRSMAVQRAKLLSGLTGRGGSR